MLSVSILSIKENIKEKIKDLSKCDIDYLHLDIMDGKFVPKETWNINEIKNLVSNIDTKKDVHLMVKDVKKYVDEYKTINPEYITFHLEIGNTLELINYIKSFNIKVGLSINPDTKVEKLLPYLSYVDLVLVMSVIPGKGGQQFIESSLNKINYLNEIKSKYNFIVEVDGGINNTNIDLINSDINVVGSFITDSDDYQKQISQLKCI